MTCIKDAELEALREPHKSIYVLSQQEAECEDCPWRYSETCKTCKQDRKKVK